MSEDRPEPRNFYLPRWLQRRGRVLLNQQCWLWGQDIRRSEGNLLLNFGFERQRSPCGVSGSSQYTLALNGDLSVCLWGFGFYFGARDGIYINRYEFVPRSAQFADRWKSADEMSRLPRSNNLILVAQAARWIAQYEASILREVGVAYRLQTLSGWRESKVDPVGLSETWQALALDLLSYDHQQQLNMFRNAQRHSEHRPYTKSSWPVATNPRGSFGLLCTSQPSSSKSLPQLLQWK